MTKRPAFLISGEGKTPDDLKREAHAALERYSHAVEEAEAAEGTGTPDPA